MGVLLLYRKVSPFASGIIEFDLNFCNNLLKLSICHFVVSDDAYFLKRYFALNFSPLTLQKSDDNFEFDSYKKTDFTLGK